jgi:hypothetical protein
MNLSIITASIYQLSSQLLGRHARFCQANKPEDLEHGGHAARISQFF